MSQQQDRFTLFYTFWIVLFLLVASSAQELDFAFQIGVQLFLLLVLSCLVLVVVGSSAIAHSLWHKQWRRLASLIAAPVFAFAFVIGLGRVGIDASWVRLQFHKHAYLEDIAKHPQDDASPRLLAWPWGVTGFVTTVSSDISVVYDESDEIALPKGQQSDEWQLREWVSNRRGTGIPGFYSGGANSGISVRRLEGHFYLVEAWMY